MFFLQECGLIKGSISVFFVFNVTAHSAVADHHGTINNGVRCE